MLKFQKGGAKADIVKECPICFNEFEDSDTIVECLLLHVFHAECFEQNKENDSDDKCPTCSQRMKLAPKTAKGTH